MDISPISTYVKEQRFFLLAHKHLRRHSEGFVLFVCGRPSLHRTAAWHGAQNVAPLGFEKDGVSTEQTGTWSREHWLRFALAEGQIFAGEKWICRNCSVWQTRKTVWDAQAEVLPCSHSQLYRETWHSKRLCFYWPDWDFPSLLSSFFPSQGGSAPFRGGYIVTSSAVLLCRDSSLYVKFYFDYLKMVNWLSWNSEDLI